MVGQPEPKMAQRAVDVRLNTGKLDCGPLK